MYCLFNIKSKVNGSMALIYVGFVNTSETEQKVKLRSVQRDETACYEA